MKHLAPVIVAICLLGCAEDEKRKGVGEACDSNADCADEICHHGACCPSVPLPLDRTCKIDAQCASFNCVKGTCTKGTGVQGDACRHNDECASGTCLLDSGTPGTCAGGGSPDGGVDGAQPDLAPIDSALPDKALPDAALKPANAACSAGAECVSGVCHQSLCTSSSPGAQGSVCKGNADCLSYVCSTAGICAAGAAKNSDACLNKEECVSGICTGNLCEGKAANASCKVAGECQSGVCHQSLCAAAKPGALGSACTGAADCLSYVCTSSKCAAGVAKNGDACLDKEECLSQICTSNLCVGKPTNASCTAADECQSGVCHKSLCAAASPVGSGAACSGHGDCLSYVCTAGFCAAGTAAIGAACLDKLECTSLKCTSGVCAANCGNKIKEGSEACDTNDFGGKTCSDFGFGTGGALECKPDCSAILVPQCFLMPDPQGIAIATKTVSEHVPTVVFNGTSYLALWARSSDDAVLARLVSTTGTLLGSGEVLLGGKSTAYRVAAACDTAGQCLAVYYDGNIRGTLIDKNGAPKNTTPLTIYPSWARYPQVAFNGTNFLVVWQSYNSGNIYARRVTPGGVLLDATPITISAHSDSEKEPAVTSDGKEFLVVFVSYGTVSKVWGVTVNNTGKPNPRFVIWPGPSVVNRPHAAYGGGQYLVAWRVLSKGVKAARVVTSGTTPVIVDPTPLSICPDPGHYPRAAYDGKNFAVVWNTDTDVYFGRVPPVGPNYPGISLSSGIISNQLYPEVAFGGGQFFTVFRDSRNGSSNYDIYGARFK